MFFNTKSFHLSMKASFFSLNCAYKNCVRFFTLVFEGNGL